MSRVPAILVALLLATVVAGDPSNRPVGRDDCDYTASVGHCAHLMTQSACRFYQCLHTKCGATFTHETAVAKCIETPEHTPMLTPADRERMAAAGAPFAKDGDNNKVVARRTNNEGGDRPKFNVYGEPPKVAASVPEVNSSCFNVTAKWSRAKIQHSLFTTSMDVYKERANEHYTEGSQRWSGIDGHVCPGSVPEYSDCSSTVTWIYWTLFGNGNDFMNGESWKAGYTGTLIQHGTQVSETSLQVGDLCFYYHPMHHVAIYVGDGKVVSHGMDPVGYYPWNYAPVDYCRRYV